MFSSKYGSINSAEQSMTTTLGIISASLLKFGVATKVIFEVFYVDGMHQLLSAETIRRSIVTTSAVPIDEFNSCKFHFWNQFLFRRIAKQMLRKK